MAFWDKLTGKKEEKPREKPHGKPKVNISVGATSLDGYGTTVSTNPILYKPIYDFPDYFDPFATFFYTPPKIADLKVHELLIKYPDKYPFEMTEPFALDSRLKPISFSISLRDLFKGKENKPETEKGKIYFGRSPGYTDEFREPRINDIVLKKIIDEYIEIFYSKFNINPTEANGINAFSYPDPRGTIDPKTGRVKIRGINDVSRGQFTLCATGNSISIVDGRTVKNNIGQIIHQPSTNGTYLYNAKGYLKKDLTQEFELEVLASAPISEFHQPTDYCYATFGHELINIGDKFTPIKGCTFRMLMTRGPLVTPETLKQEFAFKYAR